MEEVAGYLIAFGLVAALVIAILIAIGYILFWITMATVSIGVISGVGLSLLVPFNYLKQLAKRCS